MIFVYILAVIGAAAVAIVGTVVGVSIMGYWLDWDDRRALAAYKRKYGA